ncbi:hypothetical protein ACP70R_007404 [Stipagrostis hirtigluma subsp. patula]
MGAGLAFQHLRFPHDTLSFLDATGADQVLQNFFPALTLSFSPVRCLTIRRAILGTEQWSNSSRSSSAPTRTTTQKASFVPQSVATDQRRSAGAGMVPSASEEEQDKDGLETTMPAASEQKQEIEEKEITMEPAASGEQDVASEEEENREVAKIREVLSLLEPQLERCTELLEAAGPHRVTGEHDRRILAFLEVELRYIVMSLKSRAPATYYIQADDRMLRWLRGLDRPPSHYTKYYLDQLDPRRHTLLRRARHCFRRRKPTLLSVLSAMAIYFQMRAEHPCRYRNLLLSNTDPGLPTPPQQAAKPDGLPQLVGIDRPTKKLLRWLIPREEETNKSLRVMSIVGPAGIGKTTLAMELCNQLRCQATTGHNYFQYNVMAHVSRTTSRMKLLLREILSEISGLCEQSEHMTMELLVRRISECLQDKRYFICIDDIWEKSDWEEIKDAFPNNNLHSRILITTQVGSIAWSCCSDSDGYVHEMKPLNEIDSERLLLAKDFGSVDACLPHYMQLVCHDILRRCEGIPLFITGMADWLKEHWQQQEGVQLQTSAVYRVEQVPWLPKRFEQALSPAYYDLHHQLHLLALYMSMFPHGYVFDKDHLIMKWIYEGLTITEHMYAIEPEELEDMEECFFQLVDRNLIAQVAAGNYRRSSNEAGATQWQVNHFVQQFLASKAAEIGFVFTSATLNLAVAPAAGYENNTRKPRRLALHHQDPQLPSLIQASDLLQTRSLAVSGAVSGIPLDKFVNLVVLDLEGWENLKDEDLLQVCRREMFFLRYLSIRRTPVSKLPPEIKELRRLGLLDVSYTKISELPFEVFELRLIRLDVRGTQISQLQKQVVGLRDTLCFLRLGGEGIINSIDTVTRVPQEIHRVRWLHTLATIDLSEHPASFIKALGDLKILRELGITWSFHQSTDRDYRDALLSSIKRWRQLKSLTIHCGLGCSMEFLGSLTDPPKYLEKFKVTAGRFAAVPKWIEVLNSLSFLQITVCRLGEDDQKILRGLPKLQCLILGLDFIPGEAIQIRNEGFKNLKRFSIDCPLPWITFETGAMWNLIYLQLKFCACPVSQTSVPSGIRNLRRLTEVALYYNVRYANSINVKTTVEAVRKEAAGHCNPVDLFINGIEDEDVQAVDEVSANGTKIQSGTDARAQDGAQAFDDHTVSTTVQIQSEIQIESEIESDA